MALFLKKIAARAADLANLEPYGICLLCSNQNSLTLSLTDPLLSFSAGQHIQSSN